MRCRIGGLRMGRFPVCPGLLFSLLLLVFPASSRAKTTEVHIETRTAEPADWPGLKLGIAMITFKGKAPYSSYILQGLGLNDQLMSGEEPEAHLKRCIAGNYPPGLFDAFTFAPASRADCLRLLILWGDLLLEGTLGQRIESLDVEAPRGMRYLEQGFLLLLDDVKGNVGASDGLREVETVRALDFRLNDVLSVEELPTAVRNTALQYYSYVWNLLPPAPPTYDAFMLKFVTGEHLKALYHAAAEEASMAQTLAAGALQFYQQAEQFHRLVVPAPQRASLPRIVPALLQDGVRTNGIGYAVFPGETELRPLKVLAHTDIEDCQFLLKSLFAANLITQSELDARTKSLDEEDNKLRLADLNRWLALAAKQSDVEWTWDLRTQMVVFYRDTGDLANAEQLLEQICSQLREEGDLRSWGPRMVDLISYKIAREQWSESLSLIEQVKPVLADEFLLNPLAQTLQDEKLVREKLGMPAEDYTLAERLAKSLADLPDVKEPDPAKRLESLRAYLQKPNLSPVLAMTISIHIANTLFESGQISEAEGTMLKVLPDVRRWRGSLGELEVLGALLTAQGEGGDFGGFYASLNQFEQLSRKLHGENWLTLDGRHMAEIFYGLQDYHEAESLLELHRQSDYLDALINPLNWSYLKEGDVPLHDDDILLEAKIEMQLGEKDQALAQLKLLDASTAQVGEKRAVADTRLLASKKKDLLQLAEIYADLGQTDVALARVSKLLSAADPLEETDLWASAMIQQGGWLLSRGKSADDVAKKIEELAPHAAEYHELTAPTVVNMEIFLGDYYAAQNSLPRATEQFQAALTLAEISGSLDQQIILQRKLGELAARSNNTSDAADHYRQSIALLKKVSTAIPSDLGKVGYRAERNKAIPLLAMTLYSLFQQSNDQKYLNELFSAIEEGKSRALAEALTAASNAQTASLQSIQQTLPNDASLVEYYVPEGVSDKVLRLVIDRTSVSVDMIGPSIDQITNQIETLLDEVTRPEKFSESSFKTQAAQLEKILLPPSWQSSRDSNTVRHVFIVPTGVLYLFPFGLLVDQQGQYLDEDNNLDIAYLPNASVLMRSAPRFADASRSVGFMNPAMDAEHHEALSEAGDLRTSLTDSFRQWSGTELDWEKPLSATQFLEKTSAIDNVLLYTHGLFLPNDPTGSYVLFADEADKPTYVTAAQLMVTRVGRGLWVLAACSSGVAKVRPGDEALGLPRALLAAGASMVIISLWNVDTITSLDLMVRFYRNLVAGMPVSQALHRASAALRQEGRPPYDWAPFILIGHHGFEDD
jgi:CHAT domain-containing protein